MHWRDLTIAEAKSASSESGYGLMLDGMGAFWPGVRCTECSKFVGRDGYMFATHREMSSEIAWIEGECRRCMEARAAA
jgi:hypothetical protein